MSKRRISSILVFVFLMIFMIKSHYSLQETEGQFADTVVGISTGDYRAYLESNPPLDRLFREGDMFFFLVKESELKRIESSGASIVLRQPLEELTGNVYPGREGIGTVLGDVNGAYHNVRETFEVLEELENRYPSLAQVTTIGYSLEGRELKVIKISDNVYDNEQEPNIFIIGCHHAREWISVEVPLDFARYLLENYPDNPDVRRAVNGAQIYIMPIQNPDGLEYSIHTYRMWRKNRRYNGEFAWGVDTNRNYGHMWGYDNEGSSPSPWSEVFRGPEPFSEPETRAVRDFLLEHPPAGSISYHNYSQLIIYPWGYTHEPAPDAGEMHAIAAEMSARMFQVSGRVYGFGASEVLYVVNGDTIDWIYGTFGTPAYTIELPPEYMVFGGFFTSEELIRFAFLENLPALLYFVNYFAVDEPLTASRYKEPPNNNIRVVDNTQ
jgi:murein tripeptide amidase MpaA